MKFNINKLKKKKRLKIKKKLCDKKQTKKLLEV